jgi:ubiquinone/menaquinone biosynthesis C-methylase UbiE
MPSAGNVAWFSGAVRSGRARLRLPDGRALECATELVRRPDEVARIRELFGTKYGGAVCERYFADSVRALILDPTRAPVPPSPEERIRAEFDAVAPSYDSAVARQPLERYLKDRAATWFERDLLGLDPLLEIGPGTGYHTLRLLAAGHRVLGVDLSRGMIEQLERSAREKGIASRLEARAGRLRDLAHLLSDVPDAAFDGIYSAFGAFNLEERLDAAVPTLARVVRAGGRLSFTALNRPGLSPMLWDLALGRPGAAFRRTSEVIPRGGVRYPLELFVRTPTEWDRLLSGHFTRERLAPVSIVAPPFESDRLVRFLGGPGIARARRLDDWLSARPGSWAAAEWLYLSYRRLGPPERRTPGPRAVLAPLLVDGGG